MHINQSKEWQEFFLHRKSTWKYMKTRNIYSGYQNQLKFAFNLILFISKAYSLRLWSIRYLETFHSIIFFLEKAIIILPKYLNFIKSRNSFWDFFWRSFLSQRLFDSILLMSRLQLLFPPQTLIIVSMSVMLIFRLYIWTLFLVKFWHFQYFV